MAAAKIGDALKLHARAELVIAVGWLPVKLCPSKSSLFSLALVTLACSFPMADCDRKIKKSNGDHPFCYLLTSTQRNLLIRTWSDDFEFLYQLGTHIYVYIFDHQPMMKNLFPSIHAHGDAWKESQQFRAMALKFVSTLSIAIENLDRIGHLSSIIANIGKSHRRFSVRGFQPQYWDVSQDAIVASVSEHILSSTALSNDNERKQAIDAWRQLADFIVSNMKRGYDDGMQKEN